ncbi:DUF6907 domain-containing protein [Streptomyces noursei]|uniref:DUF6907 domain-containing protein n=1 Tax=Streptomyces noursei TaxID=1971 RepID=UPI0035E3F158
MSIGEHCPEWCIEGHVNDAPERDSILHQSTPITVELPRQPAAGDSASPGPPSGARTATTPTRAVVPPSNLAWKTKRASLSATAFPCRPPRTWTDGSTTCSRQPPVWSGGATGSPGRLEGVS